MEELEPINDPNEKIITNAKIVVFCILAAGLMLSYYLFLTN